MPAEAHDASNAWYGTYMTPEVIAYNTNAVKAADAPKDWDEVLDPRWKGKVLIRDPIASGSMRAIFGAILARSVARTGSTAEGWEWLRRLDGNTKEYVLNPALLYQKLGREEGTITLYNMPDIATLEARTKTPVGYVIPASGTPLLVDAIAAREGSEAPRRREAVLRVRHHDAPRSTTRRRSSSASRRARTWRTTRCRRSCAARAPRSRRCRATRQLLRDSLDAWMKYWDANIRNSRRGR